MPMKLSKLLEGRAQSDLFANDPDVLGLSLDSRNINPGQVFFAYQGHNTDGNHYIADAINKNAAAIVTDSAEAASVNRNSTCPIIVVDDLKTQLSEIAANFYDHPSKKMQIIGITGTNGKTSFCHFLAQALTLLGESVGVLGTLGNGVFGKQEKASVTTPDPIKLQAMLADMVSQGVNYVAMEVSSHGLKQGRVDAVDFDIAVFSNLSRDHLDYHGDMLAYGNAKRQLFQKECLKQLIFNIDDEFGRQLLEEFYQKKPTYAYSAEGRICEYAVSTLRAQHVHLNMKGVTASLHTPWLNGVLHASVMGRFNLSNLLAVFAVLGINGFAPENIFSALAKVQGVNGRMQLFGGGDKPYVIIDYAHTPDALKQVLMTLRDYTEGDLWCVFGCGGNRDQGKRGQMGQIAESIADNVILTDDNPRHEEPASIIADILQSMSKPERAVIEYNRRRAIAHAIHCAKSGDIILIAGKGHENYQIYGDESFPFSDEIEVQMLLTEKN